MNPPKLEELRRQWDLHALTYDLIYQASEHRRVDEEIAFIEFAVSRYAKRDVRDVLDLTAGTGLQAVALAKLGFAVTAADLSEAMLERCRKRADQAGVNLADTICRAAQETDDDQRFDACISCFGSLNHILETEGILQVFTRVHKALRSGGIFVFDLLNLLEDALSCPPEDVREGTTDDLSYRSVLRSRFDTWNSLLHYEEKTTITQPDKKQRRVTAELTYRGYSRSEILSLLALQPWSDISCYRGYTDRGESRDDRVFRMVFACCK